MGIVDPNGEDEERGRDKREEETGPTERRERAETRRRPKSAILPEPFLLRFLGEKKRILGMSKNIFMIYGIDGLFQAKKARGLLPDAAEFVCLFEKFLLLYNGINKIATIMTEGPETPHLQFTFSGQP